MTVAEVNPLGQVGVRLTIGRFNLYIDPYLSNSVQEKEDLAIARLIPVPLPPQNISNADFVLITHEHRDHCDEDTLLPIARASKLCQFIGPHRVIEILQKLGMEKNRLLPVSTSLQLTDELKIHIVPSAHPVVEKNIEDQFNAIGYIIEYQNFKLYHAGDTSLCDEVIKAVQAHVDIDIAMLPVNEKNYMRDKQGIIGNMTVREAFYFAEQIGAKTLIPTHWDMFAQNQVYQEEIELLYDKIEPDFRLCFGKFSINKTC